MLVVEIIFTELLIIFLIVKFDKYPILIRNLTGTDISINFYP
jgi:hypothetical protein